jgi:DNA-binding IclR family transcriptional regulator
MPSDQQPTTPAAAKTSPLHRVFSLLRFLADNNAKGARIPEICAHLGIHRVSTHRLLKTLIASEHVEQATDLSYRLGFEAWALGLNYTQLFVPPVITEALKRVSEASEESVFLMRRAGTEGVCIAAHDGSYPLRAFVMRIGTRRPLGVGGTSIALLTQMPEDEANRIIQTNAPEYAPYGLQKRDVQLLVNEGRAQGYVFTRGYLAKEMRTVAVGIPRSSATAAQMSLGIVALESRLHEPRRGELLRALQTAATALQDVIY